MGHGKIKKAPVQGAKPVTQKPPQNAQQTTLPPKTPKTGSREKHIIWADDNDVDFEDITFVIPIVISAVILMVFLLRKYMRWNVDCSNDNRIDEKTVVITGTSLILHFKARFRGYVGHYMFRHVTY